MNNFDPHSLEPLWDTWYIDKFIGEGSFGAVYKIYREEFGTRYYSALKIISIPKSESEEKQVFYDGMDDKSATQYFKDIVELVYKEISIMSDLKGKTNIVSYEDHKIVKKENSTGFLIIIRMELLESLNDYLLHTPLTKELIIDIGKDLCKALILCKKRDLIHRDIKPANIFVTIDGDFKLGDFGIARHLEGVQDGLSVKGTYGYMAPEVYQGSRYDERVDIYSLGMVLYYFLNNRKKPFTSSNSSVQKYSEEQESLRKRFSGEKLPKPVNADEQLAEVVLKACEYDPNNRYSSADEFLKALEALTIPQKELDKDPVENTDSSDDDDKTVVIVEPIPDDNDRTVVIPEGAVTSEPITDKKNSINKLIFIPVFLIIVVIALYFGLFNKSKEDQANKSSSDTEDVSANLSSTYDNSSIEGSGNTQGNQGQTDDTSGLGGSQDVSVSEPTAAVPAITAVPTEAPAAMADVTITPLEVNLSSTKLASLSSVADLEKITQLDISFNSLKELKELKKSLWMEYLIMESNKISDISPLSDMKHLVLLNAKDNLISDISPLSSCTSLELLILSGNKISKISDLKNIESLTNLQLDGNIDLKDISALSSMKKLHTLMLAGTGITDVEPLSELTGLTYLDISNTKIKDITPLYGLKNLTDLYMTGTNIVSEQIKGLKKALPDCNITY